MGMRPLRRVWFSAVFAHCLKLSMIFEEATVLKKSIYLFNSKQPQMDTKDRKISEIYIIRTEFNQIFSLDKVIGSKNWVQLWKRRSESGCGNWRVLVWNRGSGYWRTGWHTPIKNSNEYPPPPPTPHSPQEYAVIAILVCGVNTRGVGGFWYKKQRPFSGFVSSN